MSRILIAEDEERIASFVAKGLRSNGFTTEVVGDGDAALRAARSGAYDLLILDVGLPGLDGFEVLRELRRHDRDLPVIMLTARAGEEDTVAGLEGGADDYVTKPFRFQELVARVRARLRTDHAPGTMELRAGDLVLDVRRRVVRIAEQEVELSAREFALAEAFFRHRGQVLSREQLLSQVWGYDHDPGSNVVEVYVRYLRRKIGPERIVSVRGMGYRFDG